MLSAPTTSFWSRRAGAAPAGFWIWRSGQLRPGYAALYRNTCVFLIYDAHIAGVPR